MIELKNITKDYIGYSGPWDRILSGLTLGYMGGKVRYRALEDVSFRCSESEILGIIGRNGAGKSTLLKLVTGVSEFNSGSMKINCDVRAILELGVGFNPELSGEENVYFNGLVWGYSVRDIDSIMDGVFSFAGLEEFRDVPIKNYSSGMIMRLGFALATATPPEILIVDEALAVGDASFQQKCLKRFFDYQSQGTTTIIVSHDLTLLSQICTRILVMEKGRLIFDGDPIDAVQAYMKTIADHSWSNQATAPDEFFEYWSWTLLRQEAKQPILAFVGDVLELEVILKLKKKVPQLTIGFHLDDAKGVRVFGTSSYHLGEMLDDLVVGREYKIRFRIPLHVGVGKYSLGLSLHEGDSHSTNCYYWGENLHSFEVERVNLPKFVGMAYLPVTIEKSENSN